MVLFKIYRYFNIFAQLFAVLMVAFIMATVLERRVFAIVGGLDEIVPSFTVMTCTTALGMDSA